jgi:hypothetical protein
MGRRAVTQIMKPRLVARAVLAQHLGLNTQPAESILRSGTCQASTGASDDQGCLGVRCGAPQGAAVCCAGSSVIEPDPGEGVVVASGGGGCKSASMMDRDRVRAAGKCG